MEYLDFDFNYPPTDYTHDRPSSDYIRRRLAEATLAQDQQHDGSAWTQLDPGPDAVKSLSNRAQSLHQGLLGNAVRHLGQYMSTQTNSLAVGDALEAQIGERLQDERPRRRGRRFGPVRFAEQASEMEVDDRKIFQVGLEGGEESAERPIKRDSVEPAAASASLAFRPKSPKRTATIIYYDDDYTLKSLHDVDVDGVRRNCPLLALAFEESRSGPQLFLETLNSRTAAPFVRFLNNKSYSPFGSEDEQGDPYEDVPTSLLLHCEMFRLGDIYDLDILKTQAYVNILRQCEFGCSSPEKPLDLCAAIRFTYTHLKKETQLIDAIVNYCVACFRLHRLADDADFKQLAYDLRPFHQDLCRNCMSRDFENETAAAIIQMPFEPHRPETYASVEGSSKVEDVVFHFHANDENDSPRKRKRDQEKDQDRKNAAMEAMAKALSKRKAVPEGDEEGSIVVKSKREEEHGVGQGSASLLAALQANRRAKLEAQDEGVPAVKGKQRASSTASTDTILPKVKLEDEFEEVDLGLHREEATGSDSDSFEWVDVPPKEPKVESSNTSALPLWMTETAAKKTQGNEADFDWRKKAEIESSTSTILPLRTREKTGEEKSEGSESDSDWSLV